MRGQSLFQWTPKGARFPMSLQMPSEIAEHLAGMAEANEKQAKALSNLVASVERAAKGGFSLSGKCAEMIEARAVLAEIGA